MRVPAGRPHFNQSPNPRGTQELKLLIENLLITPQVRLTSDEANCKSGCNSKDKWTNGIMEYSSFNCTVRGLCLYEQYKVCLYEQYKVNNQSLNSAQNQGDQESSIRQQILLRPVPPSRSFCFEQCAHIINEFSKPHHLHSSSLSQYKATRL